MNAWKGCQEMYAQIIRGQIAQLEEGRKEQYSLLRSIYVSQRERGKIARMIEESAGKKKAWWNLDA